MTYPDNPPVSGGPDQVVPTGGLSDTGIAALAAKTAQDWEDELYGTADTFLTPITDLLGKLYDLFAEFVDLDGFITIASDVLGFFYNLLDRAGFFNLLSGVVDFFGWLVGLAADSIEELIKPIVELLKWVWEFITGLIDVESFQELIDQLVTALSNFLSGQQFVDLFKTLIEFFNGLFGATFGFGGAVEDFVNQLPLIGPIVAAITGKTPADGDALDLTALSTYFRKLDTRLTDGVNQLADAAKQLLRGNIPLGLIDTSNENLLSQGDFLTESTVEPASGWSWDSTRSRTGTGGSLKLDCTGSEQRIYCKQDIRVATGDVLTLTGNVGTDSFTSGSMRLSIVPWAPAGSPAVMTAQTVVNGTARNLAANTWQALPTLTYTVPAGVTAVQVSLVATGNSSAFMYFDDIRLKKKGALAQGAVENLLNAINGILAGVGFTAGTGWTFLQTAVNTVAQDAFNAFDETEQINSTLFNNPTGGTIDTLADKLGTPLLSGSGGRMYRAGGTGLVTASGGPAAHAFSGFYTDGDSSADITRSTSAGSYTVTHAGYYQVEVGFTVNAVPEIVGGFNIAPAVFVGGSLYKVGAAAFGSYAFGLGGYSGSAQSTFIVYLNAGQSVTAGYYNWYAGNNSDFFAGGASSTYFSIAMLNRTDEG